MRGACRARFRLALAIPASLLLTMVLTTTALAATSRVAVPTARVYGRDAYNLAAVAAHRAYPGWRGISHVVIASGEAAALPEAIAASSLCWAYDAPLLLTAAGTLPSATKTALAAIVSANPTVTVHVVGSKTNVPAGRIAQIRDVAPGAAVEQPWPYSNRFTLAAGIAARVKSVAAASGSAVPSIALVADATSGRTLWDALGAATVARRTGAPVFFVASGGVPAATASALFGSGRRVIVVGGTKVVPATVYAALSASERWAGIDRFGTAARVASRSIERHWSLPTTVAIAATQPAALMSAMLVGRQGGSVLLTTRDRVQKTSWYWLAARGTSTKRAYAVGTGLTDGQVAELAGSPALPWLKPSTTGRYVAARPCRGPGRRQYDGNLDLR